MFVSTKKAFQGQFVGGPRMRSSSQALESRSIYSPSQVREARARAEALVKAQGEPLTNEEALEIIRRARETEAALLAEEQAEAKAKRVEFIRRRQSAMAGLNQVS